MQEDLRRRVVAAVHGGMRQVEAARVFAVAPQSVSGWAQVWRKQGSKGQARPARHCGAGSPGSRPDRPTRFVRRELSLRGEARAFRSRPGGLKVSCRSS
ncbi:hypothetical protein FDZ84_22910 [Saccharopolyspora sp. ASAGF58]|nr:hypothetical protein FDZ84_22910 [Saccharopolyspora sp. ASAGF58]